MPARRLLVSSAPGLQPLLAEELEQLGLAPGVEPSGIVAVEGGWPEAARVLVRSRIASRVFLSIRRFASRNRAMLYDQVRRIDWPGLFAGRWTLAVRASGSVRGTDLALPYAALRIKDGVCDEFRKRGFPRPDVDRRSPDVRLQAFFLNGRCELSVDLAGIPLHRRGYRREGAEAPLRENRAAALLRFCGYDGSGPLVDPFCGSGTIAIEASLIATRTAPGLLRGDAGYAAVKLFPECEGAVNRELDGAGTEVLARPPHPIAGRDVSAAHLAVAAANAARAGAVGWVTFAEGDARDLAAPGAWIVTNPPYGERLEDREGAAALLRAFIHGAKHRSPGARLGLVLPRGPLEKAVGLRPERRTTVESGPLALRFLLYELRSGRFGDG